MKCLSCSFNPFLMDQNFQFWVPGRHREISQETQPLFQIPYNLLGWIDPRSCKSLDANSSRQVTSIFYTLEPARFFSVSWPRPLTVLDAYYRKRGHPRSSRFFFAAPCKVLKSMGLSIFVVIFSAKEQSRTALHYY